MNAADSIRPILITGGTGQIGFELVRELSAVSPVIAPSRAELDLSNPDSIRSYVRESKPGAIVNAAAYTAVDRAESEEGAAHQINAVAPGVLAEESRRLGAPLIHYSTDYVFDGKKVGAYLESDATNPLSVYGRTKLDGEDAVRSAADAWIILRCSWVYSSRGSNFLRTMLRLGGERAEISVVNDQSGSPTWAREIARATAALFSFADDRGGSLAGELKNRAGVYHLTSGECTTWYEFARAIFRRRPDIHPTVKPIQSSEYPTPARRPANSVLDSSRIAATFGIRLQRWEDQLDQCLLTKQ